MNDKRFSLWDSELGFTPETPERISLVSAWLEKRAETDPSPPEEIARVFFADSLRAAMQIH